MGNFGFGDIIPAAGSLEKHTTVDLVGDARDAFRNHHRDRFRRPELRNGDGTSIHLPVRLDAGEMAVTVAY